jgi:Uma2 family endonuclease
MTVKTQLKFMPVDDYLDGEQHSDSRHEYIAGQAYAMTGASRHHNLVAGALYAALHNHLRSGPCRVYMSDLKVRVDDIFYYPDVLVSCTANGHDYYETAPVLIVEVLSPTTEARDRMEKRLTYQRLPSLKEYVLASQEAMRIEVYRRTEEGWEVEQFSEHDELRLESVGLVVPMVDIYRDAAQA